MPEASMHKNNFLSGSENNVWAAREIVAMKTVTNPKASKRPPHS
jgi:hypothetical protein